MDRTHRQASKQEEATAEQTDKQQRWHSTTSQETNLRQAHDATTANLSDRNDAEREDEEERPGHSPESIGGGPLPLVAKARRERRVRTGLVPAAPALVVVRGSLFGDARRTGGPGLRTVRWKLDGADGSTRG
jgi:hypothetical protein